MSATEDAGGEREVEAVATFLHDDIGGCCVSRFPECVFGGDAIREEARRFLASDWLAAVRQEAGAKALTEAADDMDRTWNRGHDNSVHPFSHGLRDRAARMGGDS